LCFSSQCCLLAAAPLTLPNTQSWRLTVGGRHAHINTHSFLLYRCKSLLYMFLDFISSSLLNQPAFCTWK
jgi:hypothetical protein